MQSKESKGGEVQCNQSEESIGEEVQSIKIINREKCNAIN